MSRIVIAMPQWGNSPLRLYMKSKYIQSLRRAGAKIRWIELNDPKLEEKVLSCDGLLLPGGDDIDPSRYGAKRSEKCGKSSLLRDEAEWRLLSAFLPTRKPILCICRGQQLLNVFFGGTLHQDIPGHSDFKTRAKGCHSVSIVPGTKLDGILKESQITVNSLHHQAADRIGADLVVSAWADDGTVEALERSGHPFCVAVQWHPEHLSKRQRPQQAIFHAFIAACSQP